MTYNNTGMSVRIYMYRKSTEEYTEKRNRESDDVMLGIEIEHHII